MGFNFCCVCNVRVGFTCNKTTSDLPRDTALCTSRTMHVRRRMTSWKTQGRLYFCIFFKSKNKIFSTFNFFFFLPSLLNFTLWPLTLVVSDVAQRAVDSRKVRFADVEKVRTHASNWHFGDVGEGLTDGTAEDENSHLLVQSRYVGVPYKRLGALVQEVDPVAFSDDDLEWHKRTWCQWKNISQVNCKFMQVTKLQYGIKCLR